MRWLVGLYERYMKWVMMRYPNPRAHRFDPVFWLLFFGLLFGLILLIPGALWCDWRDGHLFRSQEMDRPRWNNVQWGSDQVRWDASLRRHAHTEVKVNWKKEGF